jgi:hypothetical protein
MSGKSIVAVIVLMVGVLTARPNPSPNARVTSQATIVVTTGTTCAQTVIGTAPNDFPVLHRNAGDTIKWMGISSARGVTVTFAGSGARLPFHKGKFNNKESSGRPTGANGNYPFQSVVVGSGTSAVRCSNAQTMGVHIDN